MLCCGCRVVRTAPREQSSNVAASARRQMLTAIAFAQCIHFGTSFSRHCGPAAGLGHTSRRVQRTSSYVQLCGRWGCLVARFVCLLVFPLSCRRLQVLRVMARMISGEATPRICRNQSTHWLRSVPWVNGSRAQASQLCVSLALLQGSRIVVQGSVVSYLDQCELEQDVALEAAILSDDEG